MTVLYALLGIAAAYLSGSVPWGVVLGKLLKGVDIRQYGSGNTGATNSMRVLGWRIALAVGVLDLLKGLVPIVIARWLDAPAWAVALMAVAATVGHCWSPFMKFRGGKGMATGGGAAIGLLPWLLTMLPLMIIIVLITRFVSLASLIATITGTTIAFIFAATTDFSWLWATAVGVIASIIIGKHWGNILRLLSGTERRFGVSESPAPQ
ncbi:MAG TPA: glycerol-3-phosphate 1-O-acyltransferase PlsY [Thermomicrobiales bacterium]|jgi:glycerol-3-phosphate acyltransferase PlsY|nr:glycerol-3-phosphate 1-O-acyltransferase PlsY [Thermomicrobiales bacterium]